MSVTIREYIRQDLVDRLGSDPGLPASLSLQALSAHYGVSFTPVREALGDLVADGVLVRRDNGRVGPGALAVKTPRRPSAPPKMPVGPAEVEAALSAEVIGRSLRREQGYLREEATAARLGVGRTAARQALIRLSGRGMVVHVPRCGWRVRPFDAADLAAYLAVRETLELKALDLAGPYFDAADLRALLARNHAGRDGPGLDNGLHRYLVDKSGNHYIREFFAREGAYYTTLFDFAAPEAHVVKRMASQHRVILRALLGKNWALARATLSEHIRAQQPIVEGLAARAATTPPTPIRPNFLRSKGR